MRCSKVYVISNIFFSQLDRMVPFLAKQGTSGKADISHFPYSMQANYRPYPMHSSIRKHNKYSCGAFMSDTVSNSSSKVSLCYWKGVPHLLDRKSSLHCWFLLNEKLVALTYFLPVSSEQELIQFHFRIDAVHFVVTQKQLFQNQRSYN